MEKRMSYKEFELWAKANNWFWTFSYNDYEYWLSPNGNMVNIKVENGMIKYVHNSIETYPAN